MSQQFTRCFYNDNPYDVAGKLHSPANRDNLRQALTDFRIASRKSRPQIALEMPKIVKHYTSAEYSDEIDTAFEPHNISDFERGSNPSTESRLLAFHAYCWINWEPYRRIWDATNPITHYSA